tara:strand:- start:10 stop:285 length:276 start_codon:yes stop_codon:yes gene_type:complete
MRLEEACHSLKLECALRNLGFVDIGWRCVAHAGLYFVQPVGIGPEDSHSPEDELLGFLVREHIRQQNPSAGRIMGATAKVAINVAIELSNK